MTVPLAVLAAGSILSGWLGAPEYLWGSRWDYFLEPVFGAQEHHASLTTELLVTLLTLAVVAAGILFAFLKYRRGAGAGQEPANLLYRLSLNKYYVDEVYEHFVVRPFAACSRFLARVFDPWIIDGAVNGVAASVQGMSWVWRGLQTGNVQHYLAGFLLGVLALLAYYIGEL